MRLCACPAPLRDSRSPDRLRCDRCGKWTPYGRPISTIRLRLACAEARSLLAQLEDDMAWDLAPARGEPIGRSSGPADPTLAAVLDVRLTQVRRWRVLAARRLERALAELKLADEAIGMACLAAETRPPDHVKAPYHDRIVFEGRPDLEEAHAAKAKRAARDQGWGTG